MMQTDEIEEDYFTPVSSTTLANIFEKRSDDQKTENESLKYTPPKTQNFALKSEETKATQCVFACALYGYEWFNNVYTAKGKLGFAIIKIIKTGFYNVVLYDSNKTTLSSTTISPTLEISVKNNVYISYFDNMQKYWNLYSTEEEVKKIADTLNSLKAVIKYSSDTENGPPIPIQQENDIKPLLLEARSQIDRESDTDSSVNRKTKLSILNRMANMGHSVLPPNTLPTEKTSDSSDNNESTNYSKTVTVRHKPLKGSVKRNSTDKNFEIQSIVEANKTTRSETNIQNASSLYTFVGGHLVPVNSSNIMMGCSSTTNEMNIFMSEQRVNNSEMRINMSRMTDKMDQVLVKISALTHKDKTESPSNFQNEILKKLLTEYETKIKSYEELIKMKGIDKDVQSPIFFQNSDKLQQNHDTELLSKKLSEVLKSNKDKDSQISDLKSELEILKEKFKTITVLETNNLKLSQDYQILKQNEKETASEQINSHLNEKNRNEQSIDIIKNILNDTFHAISANFKSSEHYSGEDVKSIVANVIKTAYENLKQDNS